MFSLKRHTIIKRLEVRDGERWKVARIEEGAVQWQQKTSHRRMVVIIEGRTIKTLFQVVVNGFLHCCWRCVKEWLDPVLSGQVRGYQRSPLVQALKPGGVQAEREGVFVLLFVANSNNASKARNGMEKGMEAGHTRMCDCEWNS